jgi:ATP-dependent Lhr-like helicase
MSSKEMSVKFEDKVIGTIGKEVRLGDRIVLSSNKWKIVEINVEKMEVSVIHDGLGGIAKWEGDYFATVDTKIVQKMKDILSSSEVFPYLNKSATEYLEKSRNRFNTLHLNNSIIVKSDSNIYCIYTWMGSRELRALSLHLEAKGYKTSLDNDLYLSIEKPNINCEIILNSLKEIVKEDIDPHTLNLSKDQIYNKFKNDKYLPYDLAKKQYLDYFCDFESMKSNLNLLLEKDKDNREQLFHTIY